MMPNGTIISVFWMGQRPEDEKIEQEKERNAAAPAPLLSFITL